MTTIWGVNFTIPIFFISAEGFSRKFFWVAVSQIGRTTNNNMTRRPNDELGPTQNKLTNYFNLSNRVETVSKELGLRTRQKRRSDYFPLEFLTRLPLATRNTALPYSLFYSSLDRSNNQQQKHTLRKNEVHLSANVYSSSPVHHPLGSGYHD
jgi:hypothetical protein